MSWIYLLFQAVGLRIIAWTFRAENKAAYAVAFRVVGFLSLLLAVVMTPLPVKLSAGFLMVLFLPRINLAFAAKQEAILSFFRTNLQAVAARDSTGFDLVSRLMPEFLTHSASLGRQEQQTTNAQPPNQDIIDPNECIIDIEVIEEV